MNRCERKRRASDLYGDLRSIKLKIVGIPKGEEDTRLKSIRPEMACVEHQIAILRLLQAEDRLVQYFWRAVFGVVGAVIGAFGLYFRNIFVG